MNTVKQMVKQLKTQLDGHAYGRVNFDGLMVDVEVLDVRKVWNRVDYLITPIQGIGEKWIESSRLMQ